MKRISPARDCLVNSTRSFLIASRQQHIHTKLTTPTATTIDVFARSAYQRTYINGFIKKRRKRKKTIQKIPNVCV